MATEAKESRSQGFESINAKPGHLAARREGGADVVVVGGGLAGLTTAALLCRSGFSVTLIERSNRVGGRARTAVLDGFYFNQGPHNLFSADVGRQVLSGLGVAYSGGEISAAGKFGKSAFAVRDGKLHRFPMTARAFLTSRLLGITGKLEFGRVFGSLSRTDFSKIEGTTLEGWMAENLRHADVADLLKASVRAVSYANDPDIQSAGSALRQVSTYTAGTYLDGGWQTLVDGLASAASGARMVAGIGATKLEASGNGWSVELSDGSNVRARSVVLAIDPNGAVGLFRNSETPEALSRAARNARAVRVACLDLALRHLPRRQVRFALGIDAPLYFSVHSEFAHLAPANGALIHVAKYLGASIEGNPRSDQEELEDFLDLLQPGWRMEVLRKRLLPNMIVANALDTASMGGSLGRPSPEIGANLFIAGDWVRSAHWLANASLASARTVARLITCRAGGPRARIVGDGVIPSLQVSDETGPVLPRVPEAGS